MDTAGWKAMVGGRIGHRRQIDMKILFGIATFTIISMLLLTACGGVAAPTATEDPSAGIINEPAIDETSEPAPHGNDTAQRDTERYGTPVLGFMDLPKMHTFGNYHSDDVPTQPGGRSEYSMYTYSDGEARPGDALLVKMERYYSTNDLENAVEALAQVETYEGSFESATINDTVVNGIDAKVAIYESATKDMGICLAGDSMYRYIWMDQANSSSFMLQFIWNPSYHDYDVSRYVATYSLADEPDTDETDTSSPTTDETTGTFTRLEPDIPAKADVDGDGNMDTVCLTVTYDEYGEMDDINIVTNDAVYAVVTGGGDGEEIDAQLDHPMDYEYWLESAYLYQSPDGECGLLANVRSPFMAAGDLWLFRYEGIEPVMVSGMSGTITGVSGGTVYAHTATLTFGCWYADCEYVVTPDFKLALKDGTLYTNLTYWGEGNDVIEPVVEISVEWNENGEWQAGVLLPGEVISPMATDMVQYFYFTTAQGKEGRITFEGTGYEVESNGMYPDHMFKELPYYEG